MYDLGLVSMQSPEAFEHVGFSREIDRENANEIPNKGFWILKVNF